jgi:hypothetical protein
MTDITWTGGTRPLKGTLLPRGNSDYEDKLGANERRVMLDDTDTVIIARDSEIQR